MIKIGIVGGTGYTGVELLRLLAVHPEARVQAITSRSEAGVPVGTMFPSLRGHGTAVRAASSAIRQAPDSRVCDVVFFATPHGVAMAQARELVGAGVKIIDLAADFRLKDPAEFERWYKMPHACPDLLAEVGLRAARNAPRRDPQGAHRRQSRAAIRPRSSSAFCRWSRRASSTSTI